MTIYWKICFILISLRFNISNGLQNDIINSDDDDDTAVKITGVLSQLAYDNVVIINFDKSILAENIVENVSNKSVILLQDCITDIKLLSTRDTFVIFVTDLKLNAVEAYIKCLSKVEMWSPRMNLLIVTSKIGSKHHKDLTVVFEYLWSKQILHAVIISTTTKHVEVTTYNPFFKSVSNITASSNLRQILDDKIHDLNKYPLRIAFTDHNDRENSAEDKCNTSLVIKNTIDYFNAKCEIIRSKDNDGIGRIFPNGTATGGIADLKSGYVDVTFDPLILRHIYTGQIDTTHPLGKDDLCVIIPQSQYVGSLLEFIKLLSTGALYAFTLTLLIMIILGTFTFKLETSLDVFDSRSPTSNIAMDTLKCFIRQPSSIRFCGNSYRILIGSIMIFATVFNCAIDAVLTTEQTSPKYDKDIDTLSETFAGNYKFAHIQRHTDFINEFLSKKWKHVRQEKFVETNLTELEQLIMMKTSNYGFLMRKSVALVVISHAQNMINGRPFYHLVKECAIPSLLVYGFKRGSPYLSRFDSFFLHLQEAGIINYWVELNAYTFYVNGKNVKYDSTSSQDDKKPLSLTRTLVLFNLWFLGVAISSFVFVCELFISKKK